MDSFLMGCSFSGGAAIRRFVVDIMSFGNSMASILECRCRSGCSRLENREDGVIPSRSRRCDRGRPPQMPLYRFVAV